MRTLCLALLLCFALCPGCALTASELPSKAPPLREFEEPLWLQAEPDDETVRAALPAGSFSGISVEDARDSLEALAGGGGLLRVAKVVENSPGDFAGVEVGDHLLEYDLGTGPVALSAPSEWRALELSALPGARLTLVLERLGEERSVELELEPRLAAAPRTASERWREEQKVGVLLRDTTEVEARAVGLGPGAGAVVLGLARSSPWRAAGLACGDQILRVDGLVPGHARALVQAIERAAPETRWQVEVKRGEDQLSLSLPLSRRAQMLRSFGVPFLLSYARDTERKRWSALFGLVQWKSTPAAWRLRLLWLLHLSGGDSDRLIEVDS